MGEAAKHLLFEGFQAGCHVVLRRSRGTLWHSNLFDNVSKVSNLAKVSHEMLVLLLPRVSSRVFAFPVASPCLWGKLRTPHSTLHTPHCTLHNLHFRLLTPHYTHSTLRTPHFTLHNPYFTLHTLHFTLHTFHSTLQTGNRGNMYKTVQIILQKSVLRDCTSMCFDICTINIRVSIPGVAFHITLLRLNLTCALWVVEVSLCCSAVQARRYMRLCADVAVHWCLRVAVLLLVYIFLSCFGKHFGCAQLQEAAKHSGMKFVEIVQDSDVQRVAEMLLLSILSKVGKMLAGLSSYRLRPQCFQHVVCRAVAGGVLAFIFVTTLVRLFDNRAHAQLARTRVMLLKANLCRDVVVFRHVMDVSFQRTRTTRTHSNHVVQGKCV